MTQQVTGRVCNIRNLTGWRFDFLTEYLEGFVEDLEDGRVTVSETPLVPMEVFEAWQRENGL